MEHTKHTPGPWRYSHPGIYSASRKVAEIDGNNQHEENITNGNLIASAPDLLKRVAELEATTGAAYLKKLYTRNNRLREALKKAEEWITLNGHTGTRHEILNIVDAALKTK